MLNKLTFSQVLVGFFHGDEMQYFLPALSRTTFVSLFKSAGEPTLFSFFLFLLTLVNIFHSLTGYGGFFPIDY